MTLLMMFTLMNLMMNPTMAMKEQYAVAVLDNISDIAIYGKPLLTFDAPATNESIPYYHNNTIHFAKGFLKNIEWLGAYQYEHLKLVVRHEYCHYVMDAYCHLPYQGKAEETYCAMYADGAPLDCILIT